MSTSTSYGPGAPHEVPTDGIPPAVAVAAGPAVEAGAAPDGSSAASSGPPGRRLFLPGMGTPL
ncbi:hypothetical protein [Streptomyces sp. NPDC014656]|uniref:hypothetical protein n=1 Tax=Streptomyces sp. NPDC014656 TaxID=3364878 RepID=UPI0036F52945